MALRAPMRPAHFVVKCPNCGEATALLAYEGGGPDGFWSPVGESAEVDCADCDALITVVPIVLTAAGEVSPALVGGA